MKYNYNLIWQKLSLTLAVLLIFGSAFAQKKVTGKVTDSSGPVPGASVSLKGTSKGTATSVDGTYSIDVAGSNAVLQVSSIGFVTQDITVGNRSVIDVVLSSDEKT